MFKLRRVSPDGATSFGWSLPSVRPRAGASDRPDGRPRIIRTCLSTCSHTADVEISGAVRMRLFLPAVIAILVLADQPARAQLQTARCIGSNWNLVLNGTTNVEGHT